MWKKRMQIPLMIWLGPYTNQEQKKQGRFMERAAWRDLTESTADNAIIIWE